MINKINTSYKSISEVAKLVNLINPITGKVSTHTLRYWEKEFKQIRPKVFAGKRRYYDINTIKVIKKIKFLLKDKGMTISGVKILINSNINDLDDRNDNSLKADTFRSLLKLKSKSLLEKINKLKSYGKKNAS